MNTIEEIDESHPIKSGFLAPIYFSDIPIQGGKYYREEIRPFAIKEKSVLITHTRIVGEDGSVDVNTTYQLQVSLNINEFALVVVCVDPNNPRNLDRLYIKLLEIDFENESITWEIK